MFPIYITLALAVALLLLCGWCFLQERRINKLEELGAKLAVKCKDLTEEIQRVDESNGVSLNMLGKELKDFRRDYGEAAIEEMRENARREKAWADGINNIMAYGAGLHGRGDTE